MTSSPATPDRLRTQWTRLERPMLALVWLSAISFSAAEGQLFYVVLVTVAVALCYWAMRAGRQIQIGRVLVNLGVLAATGVLVMDLAYGAQNRPLLAPLGHYLILIQLCKLFDRRTNRDYAQMLVLSSLLMAASTLLSPELWLGMATLVYVVLVCHTSMVFTLKRGVDGAAGAHLQTEPAPSAQQRLAFSSIRDWPGAVLARGLAKELAFIFLCAAAAFFLAPRLDWAEQVWAQLSTRSAITGFNDSPTLREPRTLYSSDEVVLKLTVRPADGSGAEPPDDLYLRGRSFGVYRESCWPINAESLTAAPSPPTEPPPELVGGAVVQDVTMSLAVAPNIFALYPVVAAKCDQGSFRRLSDLNMMLRIIAPTTGSVQYTTWSLRGPLTPQQRAYLNRLRPPPSLPGDVELTPPVLDLAYQWCGDLVRRRDSLPSEGVDAPDVRRDDLDMAIARRIAAKLQERCSYSLDFSDADPTIDGIDDFLFHMRHGHCEYFASALTAMCQALGVRARLVTGFHVDAASKVGGAYLVRGRDAHAWTEIYTPTYDWAVVDPTPGAAARPHRQGALQGLRDYWDSLRFMWFDKVIGFNTWAQRDLTQKISDTAGSVYGGVEQFLRKTWAALKQLFERGRTVDLLARIGLLLGGCALLAELVVLWRRAARPGGLRSRPWRAMSRHQRRFARRLWALLSAAARDGASGLTPRELGDALARRLDLPHQDIRGLVELYYALRWSRRPPAADELAQAEPLINRLRQTARRAPQSAFLDRFVPVFL